MSNSSKIVNEAAHDRRDTAYVWHGRVEYSIAGLDSLLACTEVQRELEKNGYSDRLVEYLGDSSTNVALFPWLGERQNEVTVKLSYWVKALETYINVNRDTPSRVQLWNWVIPANQDSKSINDQLQAFGAVWKDNVLHFDGKKSMTEGAFRRFFQRNIATKSSKTPKRKKMKSKFLKKINNIQ